MHPFCPLYRNMEIVVEHDLIGENAPASYRMCASIEVVMYEAKITKEISRYMTLTPNIIYDVRKKIDYIPDKDYICRMTKDFTKKDWKFMKRVLRLNHGPMLTDSIEKIDKITLYIDWQFHILSQTTLRWKDIECEKWNTFTHYDK